MKRTDDVFFFTLIDFLIQVFFFGLLIFAVIKVQTESKDKERGNEAEQIEKLKKAAGISNLTELTDDLTKLAPVKDLRGISDFARSAGGIEKLREENKFVSDAGGVQAIQDRIERLRKFEEGTGKPPCLFDVVNDKKVGKPLATVLASDSSIQFQSTTPQLEEVLRKLGRSFSAVKELPHDEFRKVFSPLVQLQPDCRHHLRFLEITRLVDARDAARFTFYLNISRQ